MVAIKEKKESLTNLKLEPCKGDIAALHVTPTRFQSEQSVSQVLDQTCFDGMCCFGAGNNVMASYICRRGSHEDVLLVVCCWSSGCSFKISSFM